MPEALRAAATVNVPTQSLILRTDGSGFQIDDSVTIIATVTEGEKIRQWLILLKAKNLTAEEQAKYHSRQWTL